MKEYEFTIREAKVYMRLMLLYIAALIVFGLTWPVLLYAGVVQESWPALILFCCLAICWWWYRKNLTKAVVPAIAILTNEGLQITIGNETTIIRFEEMQFYHTDYMRGKKPDLVSIRIKLKNGRKYNFLQSSNVADLQAINTFRIAFDEMARNAGVESKFLI
jgi:hypothetical protein